MPSPDCPTGLAEHLRTMGQELESHMQKEEQVLFRCWRAAMARWRPCPSR